MKRLPSHWFIDCDHALRVLFYQDHVAAQPCVGSTESYLAADVANHLTVTQRALVQVAAVALVLLVYSTPSGQIPPREKLWETVPN